MKVLPDALALIDYGVNPLTGEADAYARRILCDLSDEGVILLTAYFGLSYTAEAGRAFPANMNGFVGTAKAVASVMLARETMQDLMLFALLHVNQYDYVMQAPGGLHGFNEDDKYGQRYLEMALPQGYRLYTNCAKRSAQPHVGDRNIHAMSGRVK